MAEKKMENPRYSELKIKTDRTPEEQAEFDKLAQEEATSQDK